MNTTQIFSIILTAILTENFVLCKFLGICPFLGVSKKVDTALGMSVAVIFVMLASTAVTYPINNILVKNDMEYLQTIVFILVIAALVQLVEIVLKKYIKPLYNALGIYLPLITTNCAVLGVVLLNLDKFGGMEHSFALSMVNSLGAGVGFMVAMLIFAGVRSRLETADIPEGLKGLPSTLIAAALTSVSFLGFSGVIDGIFG
jgi:electron transport complex protein RnfA